MKTKQKKRCVYDHPDGSGSASSLTAGTILCVAASVAASLVPPLLLARVVDRLNAGAALTFFAVLGYFAALHWRESFPPRRRAFWCSLDRK